MINRKTCRDAIISLVDYIEKTQKDNIKNAAMLLKTTLENKGRLFVFGSGHSMWVGKDITGKIGSLPNVIAMDINEFVFQKKVSLKEFNDPINLFERKSGMAKNLFELYDVHHEDAFLIVSNSGINGLVIDLAIEAQKRGNAIIVITSSKHTLVEKSRHPSGKKLYEFSNIWIDNGCEYGDGMVDDGKGNKIGSFSSITNSLIAQCIIAETKKELLRSGSN